MWTRFSISIVIQQCNWFPISFCLNNNRAIWWSCILLTGLIRHYRQHAIELEQINSFSEEVAGLQPGWLALPEPLGLVVQGPRIAAVGGLVELGEQGLACLLARVVGKFHRDGLSCSGRLLSIQALDGLLCLYSLIKANEAYATRTT